jgi:hypothetical protein
MSTVRRQQMIPVRVWLQCACGGELRSMNNIDLSVRGPLQWIHWCSNCGARENRDREHPYIEHVEAAG